MIGRWVKPASSSPRRIAPTMPSIIPDGAIMWAPARAWLSACSTRSGSVASLSTSIRPPISAKRAAMAVVGVFAETEVGDHQEIGSDPPGEADRLLNDAVVAGGGRTESIFVLGNAEKDDRRDAQLGDLGERLAEPVE